MHFIRLISAIIIFFTLSGCQFNIEKVRDLQSRIEQLEEENENLTKKLDSNKNALSWKNAKLESCLIEVENHESGLAEKHDFWLKVGILTILFIFILLVSWIKFDYYLTEKKAPKEDEIAKSRNLIENEKSLVEKIKSQGEKELGKIHQLIEAKESLLSEIEQLEKELEEKKDEVTRKIAEAEQQLQGALEKVAAAETKIKRLNAFKK